MAETDSSSVVAKHYKKVFDSFAIAETRLKHYEDAYGKGLVVASLNEIRYAANHTLQATQALDTDEKLDQLNKAERHCKRAAYDACASAMTEQFLLMQRFRDYYCAEHFHHVNAVIPDYNEHLVHFRDARSIIQNVRLNDGKEEYYEQLDERLVPIKGWVDLLYDEYIPQVKLLIEAENTKKIISDKRHKHMVWLSSASVIVAVVAIIVAIRLA